ncbi:MAG TPA: hypothetical protein PLE30_03600 [Candidatus Kapabacteria bacterium]|nr:hypothetical protein [Candidatus Kapabacteria bacterium]
MKIVLVVVFVFCNLTFSSIANDILVESESRWESFLKNFYSKPDYVKNKTLLSAFYGRSFTDINQKSITKFSEIHNLDFYYGFIRVNDKIKFKDMFSHQGEYAFISNTSTNFKTFKFQLDGIVTDSWRFGFGLNDGYGINLLDNRLYFNHSTALTWIRIDVDYFSGNENDIDFIKRFDERFKFGSLYKTGLTYQLYDVLNLEINYEHAYYFPDFQFIPWFGSFIVDNIIQRGPELFEKELEATFKNSYPFIKMIYKNIASFILTELRRYDGYAPFPSEHTLNYDTFKIGIVLII